MSSSTFTAEDDLIIRREFEALRLAALKRCADQEQYDLVLKAFEFANEAHRNVRRRSGEPYILHPIAVAKIVVQEIGLGCKSICAALLHDVVEDTQYTADDIRQVFGEKIASLVEGLTKIKTALDNDSLKDKPTRSLQAENFKRILLTLNDDARIVLIKLADRLHNVRTIQYMPEYKREKILSETMYIFIPLAHRLGLYNIKSEMEDVWMQYNESEEYKRIEGELQQMMATKGGAIENFVGEVEQIIENSGIRARIIKRLKSPYSIWRKMQTKNIPFEQIFDIYAVRIVFEPRGDFSEREQCWHLFSQITGRYHYNPNRVRDWVSEPKVNGYESLHVTVMYQGMWIEVQIRSERMNSIAERGVAAHWSYKQGEIVGEGDSSMDRWLKYVQDILENPDANALQFLDDVHQELLTSEIYVFTPTGESRRLPKGSTALDFAFNVHSQIGCHAIAAKVNMKLVTLSTVLRGGDQVEIITSESAKVKREWLEFLKTSSARSAVIEALKDMSKDNVSRGMKMLREELAKRNIQMQTRVIRKLVDSYKITGGKEDLYNKIGIGLIDLSDLDTVLKTNAPQRNVQMWGFKLLESNSGKLKERLKGKEVAFHTSGCCHPIPGDNVGGVIGDDDVVTIHKTSCPVYTNLAATEGNRIVGVRWSKHFMMSYLARISLTGIDRMGILHEITNQLSNKLGINLRKISIEAHDEIFEGYIDLYVHDRADIDNIIESFAKINGIEKVSRVDIE
ncbi:MAG: bifunctional (p)ppGpp synthetase/guanosine-3',5'-bis(diphosphate) 3'-pyrophosphohydrolase [Bacteroidales bacterium]|jgi:GTP pyrophosphokinase|nr:bifunctional (p)ppGpp synthetase/guanosine-3',5'-bis(diphosphate) 3'-pyrophosphohydrolase [Bacteroidales bacterium]MBQ5401821.1 bifunctional (p)ppGpp synthetase/guanosine-3',5'-bis(diphosphate) 3'-pyrophosphohydrolase [Bacteroidales bacterium]MBQ9529932.1 bifunctional (p)ppGpp synthetase/guanosine-3',5'-bis(diphosphate) 3'-pyrophosphohydrolase [Bacteroidales bacterium]